jgi:hypothetical protein
MILPYDIQDELYDMGFCLYVSDFELLEIQYYNNETFLTEGRIINENSTLYFIIDNEKFLISLKTESGEKIHSDKNHYEYLFTKEKNDI